MGSFPKDFNSVSFLTNRILAFSVAGFLIFTRIAKKSFQVFLSIKSGISKSLANGWLTVGDRLPNLSLELDIEIELEIVTLGGVGGREIVKGLPAARMASLYSG